MIVILNCVVFDWADKPAVFRLPIATDWSELHRERIAALRLCERIKEQAVLASIEAVVCMLGSRGWIRRYANWTSHYYRPPDATEDSPRNMEIRISSHLHPRGYCGFSYIITPEIVIEYDALRLATWIESDWAKIRLTLGD